MNALFATVWVLFVGYRLYRLGQPESREGWVVGEIGDIQFEDAGTAPVSAVDTRRTCSGTSWAAGRELSACSCGA